MAPVTLPPSFFNSFWSPDYRTGLEVLFKNLEQVRFAFRRLTPKATIDAQGCLEDDDVAIFIEVSPSSSVPNVD